MPWLYDCELSTQEAETGRPRVQGQRETLSKNKHKTKKQTTNTGSKQLSPMHTVGKETGQSQMSLGKRCVFPWESQSLRGLWLPL